MAEEPCHELVPIFLKPRLRSVRERFVLWLTGQLGPEDAGVYAHLVFGHPRRAIVFVHGFAGDALQTWTKFPDLLTEQPELADCDLIFYSYDTFSQQLGNMATPFMRFLRELLQNPAAMINRGRSHFARRASVQYDEVLIVAHSLGAVVTRRALLDAQGNTETWVAKTRFMLFAPADCGANQISLVSESLQGVPFGTLGSGAIKFSVPVLASLEPGCGDLQDLLRHTNELTAGGGAPFLFAERVLWASNETVTTKKKFLVREWADEIPNTTHTSVCKPMSATSEALDHVLRTLRRVP